MRVYHERLYVPLGWWLLGLVTIFLLATELAAAIEGARPAARAGGATMG